MTDTRKDTYYLPFEVREHLIESGRAIVVPQLLTMLYGYERVRALSEAEQNKVFLALREALLERAGL